MVFVSCRKPERIFAMNFNQKKDLKSAMEQVRIINSLEERIRNFEPEDFQNATRNFKLRLSRLTITRNSTDLDLAALGLAGAAAALAASRKRKTER